MNSGTPRLPETCALVVEDHPESASLLRAILEPCGMAVVTVRSAAEAEVMLKAIRPEVILCDIVLPGEDELSFVRRLRQHEDSGIRSIPTIAMTAFFERIEAHTAHQAGFDILMKKPVDPEQVQVVVARLVGRQGLTPPQDADR